MKVTIELCSGANHNYVFGKGDIDKNIEAIQRAIDGKQIVADMILLMDTKSILEEIKKQLEASSDPR